MRKHLVTTLARRTYSRKSYLLFEKLMEIGGRNIGASLAPWTEAGRVFSRSELPHVAALTGIGVEECARRHDAGDICLGVLCQSDIGCTAWLHLGPCYIRGAHLLIEARHNDAYVYGVYTPEAYRGRGLYKTCLSFLETHAHELQCSRILQLVERANRIVRTTLPRFGYAHVMDVQSVTIAGLRYTRTRRAGAATWTVRVRGIPCTVHWI